MKFPFFISPLGSILAAVAFSGYCRSNGEKVKNGTYSAFITTCSSNKNNSISDVQEKIISFLRDSTAASVWLPIRRVNLGGWYWLSGEYHGELLSRFSKFGMDCAILRTADKLLDDVVCNKLYHRYLCQRKGSCDRGIANPCYEINGTAFQIYNEEVSWYGARTRCTERGEELAVLGGSYHQEVLQYLHRSIDKYFNVWVGLRKSDYFLHPQNKSLETYNWNPQAPCPCESTNACATIEKKTDISIYWTPASCDSTSLYLCFQDKADEIITDKGKNEQYVVTESYETETKAIDSPVTVLVHLPLRNNGLVIALITVLITVCFIAATGFVIFCVIRKKIGVFKQAKSVATQREEHFKIEAEEKEKMLEAPSPEPKLNDAELKKKIYELESEITKEQNSHRKEVESLNTELNERKINLSDMAGFETKIRNLVREEFTSTTRQLKIGQKQNVEDLIEIISNWKDKMTEGKKVEKVLLNRIKHLEESIRAQETHKEKKAEPDLGQAEEKENMLRASPPEPKLNDMELKRKIFELESEIMKEQKSHMKEVESLNTELNERKRELSDMADFETKIRNLVGEEFTSTTRQVKIGQKQNVEDLIEIISKWKNKMAESEKAKKVLEKRIRQIEETKRAEEKKAEADLGQSKKLTDEKFKQFQEICSTILEPGGKNIGSEKSTVTKLEDNLSKPKEPSRQKGQPLTTSVLTRSRSCEILNKQHISLSMPNELQ